MSLTVSTPTPSPLANPVARICQSLHMANMRLASMDNGRIELPEEEYMLICDIFLYYRTRSTSAPSSVRSRRSTRSVWNSTPLLSAGKRVFFRRSHRKEQKRRHNHDSYTKVVMNNREKAGSGIRLCFFVVVVAMGVLADCFVRVGSFSLTLLSSYVY